MRPHHLPFVLSLCAASSSWLVPYALANTEIINFEASETQTWPIPQTAAWPVLRHGSAGQTWTVHPAPLYTDLEDVCEPMSANYHYPCPHELWLGLDLDSAEWTKYYKFTLRISWPASSPADFSIQLFDTQSLSSSLFHNSTRPASSEWSERSTSRRKYARIRLVDTGVRTPPSSLFSSFSSFSPFSSLSVDAQATSSSDTGSPQPVTFNVLLEPLYLGLLPLSLVPTVLFLLPLCVAALVFAGYVNKQLSSLAEQARVELEARAKKD